MGSTHTLQVRILCSARMQQRLQASHALQKKKVSRRTFIWVSEVLRSELSLSSCATFASSCCTRSASADMLVISSTCMGFEQPYGELWLRLGDSKTSSPAPYGEAGVLLCCLTWCAAIVLCMALAFAALGMFSFTGLSCPDAPGADGSRGVSGKCCD